MLVFFFTHAECSWKISSVGFVEPFKNSHDVAVYIGNSDCTL